MSKLNKYYLLAGLLLLTTFANAQDATQPTDFMRSDGKIYVVVAVLLVILLGLFGYVASLDKKISKLEKK